MPSLKARVRQSHGHRAARSVRPVPLGAPRGQPCDCTPTPVHCCSQERRGHAELGLPRVGPRSARHLHGTDYNLASPVFWRPSKWRRVERAMARHAQLHGRANPVPALPLAARHQMVHSRTRSAFVRGWRHTRAGPRGDRQCGAEVCGQQALRCIANSKCKLLVRRPHHRARWGGVYARFQAPPRPSCRQNLRTWRVAV